MLLLIFIVFFGVLVLWLWQDTFRPRDFPPGPSYWPFFGNLPQILWGMRKLKNKHKILEELAKEYGDVIGLRLVNEELVVVSGRETVKEVLMRDEFNGRPDGFVFLFRSEGEKRGLAFIDEDHWTEQRKLALKILKDFGFGKSSMETLILEEISYLVESIKQQVATKSVEMDKIFTIPVINILWMIMAGKRLQTSDKKLHRLLELMNKMFKALDSSGSILNQFPWIRYIFPETSGFKAIKENTVVVHKFLLDTIEEHTKTLSPEAPRDVIDAYLIEMSKSQGQATKITKKQILGVCQDLFEAGSETTSNAISFFMLYMVRYPEVQMKIQKEIDAVIGRGRTPSLQHKVNMHYTEAAIMETSRLSPVTPLLVPHSTRTNVQLKNYTIKKGTTILISAYSLHVDSNWKDPLEFRPERFIGEDGKLIEDENLLPFGMGKRRCIGETLARATLFLCIVSLLQQFDLRSSDDEPLPSLESVEGFTQSPKPFKVIFTSRADP